MDGNKIYIIAVIVIVSVCWQQGKYSIMHELPWITICFAHEWDDLPMILSRVKIIGKSHHEWPKIVIHGNECIILFLTRYFMFWTQDSTKNNHRSLILPSSPRTVFSDYTLWRHRSWSVTSRELALWRHIRRLFWARANWFKSDLH